MTFEQAFTLDVPSTTQNLALIRDFVNRISAQAGFDVDEMAKLELAVDEACANVIEHAYGNEQGKQVMVRASFDDEVLRITVVDTGRGSIPRKFIRPIYGSLSGSGEPAGWACGSFSR